MNIKNYNKAYETNNHTTYSCQYHIVFCPKYGRNVLVGSIKEKLEELILEKQDEYQYKVLEQDIMPDSVHLYINVYPPIGVFTIVNKIKGYTSRMLRELFPELKKRLPTMWNINKFISSVGDASLIEIQEFIKNQKNV
jgi:putative transposase